MKVSKLLNEIFLIIILLLLCDGAKCSTVPPSEFVSTSNFLPITKSYPTEFINITENLQIISPNFKNLVHKMMNSTKVCEKYLTIEIPKRVQNMMPRVLSDPRYKLFTDSSRLINEWYENLLKNLNAGDNPEIFVDMDNNVIDPSAIVSVWLNYIEEFDKEFMSRNFSTINNDFNDSVKLTPSPTYNIYNCLALTVLNGYAQVVNAYRLDGNNNTDEAKAVFEGRREKFEETLILIGQQWQNVLQNIAQTLEEFNRSKNTEKSDISIEFSLQTLNYSYFMKKDYLSQLFNIK